MQGGMGGLNLPGLIVRIDSNLFVAKKKQMEFSSLLSFGRGQERRCITPKPPWGLQVASLGFGPLKEAAKNLKTLNSVAIINPPSSDQTRQEVWVLEGHIWVSD